ncbi:hypothetical protein M422DRAFT_260185 [Sphaerobolus stellatus SS14]|uniref:3-dehydroquinate synthase N-terminal domain-containing protein n=1 Tax=Sphaerobolus stellatus (strain SS14) TaxID=990650 RepID=A0A0C9U311_SPHS4|nr:hypothetical protein M422DRAFT_260185 [Sphaerobolus stellatus SS14]
MTSRCLHVLRCPPISSRCPFSTRTQSIAGFTSVLQNLPSSTRVLINDTRIAALYLDFTAEFQSTLPSGRCLLIHVVPPGETSESRECKAEIKDYLLSNACITDTVFLALSGGVIDDNILWLTLTLTLEERLLCKNLIGAFWWPEYIFIDAAFLETLPTRELSNGMADVVKTAAIWNKDDFALLESRSQEIFEAIQTPSQNYTGRTRLVRRAKFFFRLSLAALL